MQLWIHSFSNNKVYPIQVYRRPCSFWYVNCFDRVRCLLGSFRVIWNIFFSFISALALVHSYVKIWKTDIFCLVFQSLTPSNTKVGTVHFLRGAAIHLWKALFTSWLVAQKWLQCALYMCKIDSRKSFNCQRIFTRVGKLWTWAFFLWNFKNNPTQWWGSEKRPFLCNIWLKFYDLFAHTAHLKAYGCSSRHSDKRCRWGIGRFLPFRLGSCENVNKLGKIWM